MAGGGSRGFIRQCCWEGTLNFDLQWCATDTVSIYILQDYLCIEALANLKKKKLPPSLGFHLCIYILSLRSCRDFVPILLIRLKYFQEFGWSPPVNTGKVNLTRFSKTFGVFSSLSLHFVFEQRQWGLWAIKANLFGIAGCVFQAPPKNRPSQVRKIQISSLIGLIWWVTFIFSCLPPLCFGRLPETLFSLWSEFYS